MAAKAIFLIGPILVVTCLAADLYTTQYDNIDVDDVIRNERLLKNYISCLDNSGPCTPDGKELKNNLPDALETGCSKCSGKQKAATEKVVNFLIDNKPEDWLRLEKLYDSTGQYRDKYLLKKETKQ